MEEVLELVLEPPAVAMQRPRPGGQARPFPCLQLDTHNCLHASINGHECRALLDTGTTATVVFWDEARRLGLIRGTEATTPLRVRLPTGSTVVAVVEVPRLTVVLGQGVVVVVVVVSGALVLPAWLEQHHDVRVILDASVLRRGAALQAFHRHGSALWVRRPHALARPPARRRCPRLRVLRVRLARGQGQGQGRGVALSMLVDTGAADVYVSGRLVHALFPGRTRHALPQGVLLHVRAGCYLHAQPLHVLAAPRDDFILGTSALRRHGGLLDHARHTLTLCLQGHWCRARLAPRPRTPRPSTTTPSPTTSTTGQQHAPTNTH